MKRQAAKELRYRQQQAEHLQSERSQNWEEQKRKRKKETPKERGCRSSCTTPCSNKKGLHSSWVWELTKPSYQKAEALTLETHTTTWGFRTHSFRTRSCISFSLICCHGDWLALKEMQRWREEMHSAASDYANKPGKRQTD